MWCKSRKARVKRREGKGGQDGRELCLAITVRRNGVIRRYGTRGLVPEDSPLKDSDAIDESYPILER